MRMPLAFTAGHSWWQAKRYLHFHHSTETFLSETAKCAFWCCLKATDHGPGTNRPWLCVMDSSTLGIPQSHKCSLHFVLNHLSSFPVIHWRSWVCYATGRFKPSSLSLHQYIINPCALMKDGRAWGGPDSSESYNSLAEVKGSRRTDSELEFSSQDLIWMQDKWRNA